MREAEMSLTDSKLSELSPRDITWKTVKPQSQTVANAYAGTAYDKYYERMQECSGWLRFALVPTGSGEIIHKLQSAHFCHVRHCPVCAWRKSLMQRAKAFRAMRKIVADYPGKRYIYLTLTVRDCELNQLGETLTWMNKSWERLTHRKNFPAISWLRSVEVTKKYDIYYDGKFLGTHGQTWIDKWINTHKKGFNPSRLKLELSTKVHPHFHALLMVNPSYFTHGYISQKQWRELWRESLRVEYDPSVDIKVVKPIEQKTTVSSESEGNQSELEIQPIDEGIATAIRYTLKYSTKPDEFLSTDTSVSELDSKSQAWLLEITKQMHKRRSIALGGIFKQYMSENDPTNLVRDDEALDTGETEESDPRITYVWRDVESDYLLAA